MRHLILVGALVSALGLAVETTLAQSGTTSLGSVTISKRVLADGKPLQPGTYQVRLTADMPKPGVGQSPEGERYVEFVRNGKVVAREVATVVSNADMATISDGRKPTPNSVKVELLKGDDFVRVWINRAGTNYLIHLPTAA
jgi:hypothetical protein